MRLLLGLVILLAFPVLEIWLLVELGDRYGWWVLAYVLIVAMLGWRLILDERSLLAGRMMQTLSLGGTPAKAMFMSIKNLVAGILLIIPGVITDAMAAVLLLLPAAEPASGGTNRYQRSGAANDDIIEGEFRRED
jgi:UPF0716 protein FxsA